MVIKTDAYLILLINFEIDQYFNLYYYYLHYECGLPGLRCNTSYPIVTVFSKMSQVL